MRITLCIYVGWYNMENVSKEFRGCSTQTPADVVRNDADLPHGCHRFRAGGRRFAVQASADLPCGFGLKMAETRGQTLCATTLKDQEIRRKDRSNYHCKNRTYLDMKY